MYVPNTRGIETREQIDFSSRTIDPFGECFACIIIRKRNALNVNWHFKPYRGSIPTHRNIAVQSEMRGRKLYFK